MPSGNQLASESVAGFIGLTKIELNSAEVHVPAYLILRNLGASTAVSEVKNVGTSPMKLLGQQFNKFKTIQEKPMSITGISSLSSSQASAPVNSLRSQEDQAGRQLELALQSGDLATAQQAYNTLSAFGPNNSGPFSNPALASQFAAVGQALQSGDLASAQQLTNTLGKNLLTQDFHIAKQDFEKGGAAGAQQAIANLEGDYWAVTGQGQPVAAAPTSTATTPAPPAPAINVQA
jgi:hypothetical protein